MTGVPRWIFPGSAAIAIVGAKFWLIRYCNCGTPFWDQWEAEAERLYIPYLGGRLNLQDLFSAHNGHRIFLTRVLDLALLETNGFWDPVLQMCVNALIYGAAIFLLVTNLGTLVAPLPFAALCLISAIALSLPFAWENTTWGFQSQFYFLFLASFAAIAVAHASRAFSLRWWTGLALAVLAHFTFSAGAMALGAIATLSVIQIIRGSRSGAAEWLAAALQAALFFALVASSPNVFAGSSYGPESIARFMSAIGVAASWPVGSWDVSGFSLLVLVSVVQAPLLVMCICTIAKSPPLGDKRWFVVAVGGWLALQFIVFSYGRGSVILASRYLDVFAISIPLNATCLLYFMSSSKRWRMVSSACAGIWLSLVVSGIYKEVRYTSLGFIEARASTAQIQMANVRAFLATDDAAVLQNKGDQHVSFWDVNRLVAMLRSPELRTVLPPELLPEQPKREPGQFKAAALAAGPVLAAAGLLTLFAGISILGAAALRRTRNREAI